MTEKLGKPKEKEDEHNMTEKQKENWRYKTK